MSNSTVLALDTSSALCSVALLHQNHIWCKEETLPRQHAQIILPMIEALLENASIELSALHSIVYGRGPGSFTGVRIAQSVAETLAFVLQKPITPISSMAAIAQTAYLQQGWKRLFVAIESGKQKFHWGLYEIVHGAAQLLSEEQESLVTDFTLAPQQENNFYKDCYGVGSGFLHHGTIIQEQLPVKLRDISTSIYPSAKSLINLAKIDSSD